LLGEVPTDWLDREVDPLETVHIKQDLNVASIVREEVEVVEITEFLHYIHHFLTAVRQSLNEYE